MPPPRPRNPFSIENVVPGRLYRTSSGEVYKVEEFYPHDYEHGHTGLRLESSLNLLAEWAGSNRIKECSLDRFAYLDIETTGLMGGTGTYAFLVGIGRFEEEGFHLAQFFMRDPVEEPAQLLAIEEFLAPCEALVTFNGKSFDVPILSARYITQGWKPLLASVVQVDLLHISRRLWRERLPSRTLGNIETHILGARRTEEDVPGWMIPGLFFDYLRSGDARPLKSVFYHNGMDVLALAALFNHICRMLEDPLHMPGILGLELVETGRLFEDLGYIDQACEIYYHSLEQDLPEDLLWDTVQRLSLLKKRAGDFEAAVVLWQQAASHKQIYAHVELAKYFEHHRRDYAEAARWTHSALDTIQSPDFSPVVRQEWLAELEHRMRRLIRRLAGDNTLVED